MLWWGYLTGSIDLLKWLPAHFCMYKNCVHVTIIPITNKRMSQHKEFHYLLNVQSTLKGNNEFTCAFWWPTKSTNFGWRLFMSTPFLAYAFPIKDLRKIAILLANHSKCIGSIDSIEDKMSMHFSERLRHNTTHWLNSHSGMKY